MSRALLECLRIVSLVGIASIFSVPFLLPVHRLPLTSFDSEWAAGLLLSATVMAAGLAGRVAIRVQWHLPAFLILLLAICALQAIIGRHAYSYASLNLLIACLVLLMSYGLGRWVIASGNVENAVFASAIGLVGGGLLSVAIQCLQLAGLENLPTFLFFEGAAIASEQPFANLGQPNQLATYLILGSIAATLFESKGWSRLVVRVMQIFLFAGVAFTQSRMGLLMVVLFALSPLLVQSHAHTRSSAFHESLPAAALGGYALGVVLGPLLSSFGDAGAISPVNRLANAAYGDRWTMWGDAFRIALAHPWLGTGVGEYATSQYEFAHMSKHTIGTPYAHNAVLQLAAEFGWAASWAFIALAVWWFAKDYKRRLSDPIQRAIWLMMAALALHAMLEWSLWVLFVLIVVGILYALGESEPSAENVSLDSRSVLVPVGLAGLLYAPVMMLDFNDVAEVAEKVEFELGIGLGVHSDMQSSLRLLSGSTYFKPQVDRYLLRAAPPVTRPVSIDDIERTRRVLTRLPEYRTVAVYIAALALSGRVAESLPHVERMRIFAVTPDRYREAADMVLKAISDEGEDVEQLRRELARWH